MLACFSTHKNKKAIPITLISQKNYRQWFAEQSGAVKQWLEQTQLRTDIGAYDVRLIPNASGGIARVVCCIANPEDMWSVGNLSLGLPEGLYKLEKPKLENSKLKKQNNLYMIAWGLGAYQFTRYRKNERVPAKLYVDDTDIDEIENIVASIYLTRDLINTPTDDMGPTELASAAHKLAKSYGAKFSQIIGKDLLKHNYASIYTVGRASDDAPRLLDLRWGNYKKNPLVTLVGKGVCFDSGGLDIKPSGAMLLMKKDMAGAAHVLGLARMIMNAKLPIALRVLIPCVENVISGNAYRPGDIIKSRKGITVEIGNTDAEGRVVLADALTEAQSEKPKLIIDMASLTGAARVALGPDLPAVFSNDDRLVKNVIKVGDEVQDYMWHMPLYLPYREYLVSLIADINNNSFEPYGGAITAALFLKEFVPDSIPWLHFDMMAWNVRPRPGRMPGAEALNLRALFAYLKTVFV